MLPATSVTRFAQVASATGAESDVAVSALGVESGMLESDGEASVTVESTAGIVTVASVAGAEFVSVGLASAVGFAVSSESLEALPEEPEHATRSVETMERIERESVFMGCSLVYDYDLCLHPMDRRCRSIVKEKVRHRPERTSVLIGPIDVNGRY